MKIPNPSIIGCVLLLAVSLPVTVMSQPELDNKAKQAIQKSDVSALAAWFADNGDINWTTKDGNTLLMIAAKVGDRQTLDFLFSQRPDLDAQNEAGATALMIAAKYGHTHVVKMLLERGADPLIKNNNGVTAARFALAYDHNEAYKILQRAEDVAQTRSS